MMDIRSILLRQCRRRLVGCYCVRCGSKIKVVFTLNMPLCGFRMCNAHSALESTGLK